MVCLRRLLPASARRWESLGASPSAPVRAPPPRPPMAVPVATAARRGTSSGGAQPQDLHLLDAHAVVALLRDGRVSPQELIGVVESRLEATEGIVHATPTTCFDRAREAAAKLKHPEKPP